MCLVIKNDSKPITIIQFMHNRSEKRDKKESKSAERKTSIKKDQINLLLYKNSQIQGKGK